METRTTRVAKGREIKVETLGKARATQVPHQVEDYLKKIRFHFKYETKGSPALIFLNAGDYFMKSKKCFKCGVVKELAEYYKHKKMGDGHLNKCKECTKKDVAGRIKCQKVENPYWVEQERSRGREKYHRLYRGVRVESSSRAETANRHLNKFPEKRNAKNKCQRMLSISGFHKHHWSYNAEHLKDIFYLTIRLHNLVHRNMVYDQGVMMYRDLDGNFLDTKIKAKRHIEESKLKYDKWLALYDD